MGGEEGVEQQVTVEVDDQSEGTYVSRVMKCIQADTLARDEERAERYLATVRPPMAGARLVRAPPTKESVNKAEQADGCRTGEGAVCVLPVNAVQVTDELGNADATLVEKRAARRLKRREGKKMQVTKAKERRRVEEEATKAKVQRPTKSDEQ
ncbi:hypothetical protein PInf_008250 [Phytophthora infestans]|nr:hypothetical protein PInf_008250 [Phytophthora infestans]